MNAVNLIPADSRRRRLAPSTSWPTLALIAALLVVLAGAVVYVTATNKVKSRQAELAQVTASANSWKRAASTYQSFTQTAQQRNQELADIRQLVVGRYPWEQLLSQIAGLLPRTAGLTSLQAATSTPGSPAGSTASASTSSGTGSATSGTGSAAPSAGNAASPLPAVQLSGCAASQSSVAQTMVQLRRIEGVTAVTLASASEASGSATAGASASTGSGGGCPFPVQFQMSLTFAAPAATPTAPAGSGTGASATGTPSTPATGSGSSTPTASAPSTSTGA
jgi:Tfp pilus assembly protein PilN